MAGGQDIFVPVSSGPIPNTIDSRNDHPVPKNEIVDTDTPVETNKFYCGLFLGTQTNGTFTHPYSVNLRALNLRGYTATNHQPAGGANCQLKLDYSQRRIDQSEYWLG
jgi:endoglucanase Acf2